MYVQIPPNSLITDDIQASYTHVEHVIQEGYPCAAFSNASAIKVDFHMHICLLSYSLDLSNPRWPYKMSIKLDYMIKNGPDSK